jgi:hypothetical protein
LQVIDIDTHAWRTGSDLTVSNHVAQILRPLLRRGGLETDSDAAALMRALGFDMTADNMQRLCRGERRMRPLLAKKISDMLRLPDHLKHRLHRAAAADYGYEIGNLEGGPDD